MYDGLDARTRIKDYKKGGSSVKFEVFHGHSERSMALTFIQQFDTRFMGGIFYESSKIRKAATFLKGMLYSGGQILLCREKPLQLGLALRNYLQPIG